MKPTAARPHRITLRARLTLVYTGIFLAAGVVLLGTTYALFNQQLNASGVNLFSVDAGGGTDPPAAGAPPSTDSGATAPQPVEPPAGDTDAPGPAGGQVSDGETREWMKVQRDRVDDAAANSLLGQGAIALVLAGAAAAVLGWLVSGRMLAPLHRVTDTTRRIAGAPAADRGLHERIALRGPDDEVKDLADNFDTMVERLDRSFDGQRRFVANASHELRTPLTVGRALIETAMHRRSASTDVMRLGEDLLEVNSRHEQLITGLLLLATSENELTDRYPVDLADVVGHVIAQTEPEARRAGVAVEETHVTEAPTTGDALLLERLVSNLVENAVRHNVARADGAGDARGWVGVTTRPREDGLVEVVVANTGPVVRPYEVPLLFEPFRRLGTDRLVTAKGAGLGLSIVRSVARAHGGEVAALPRADGGMEVTVTLPMAPEDEPEAAEE